MSDPVSADARRALERLRKAAVKVEPGLASWAGSETAKELSAAIDDASDALRALAVPAPTDARQALERAIVFHTAQSEKYALDRSFSYARDFLDNARRAADALAVISAPAPTEDDADYSPAYQDEYQRLWHEASARFNSLTERIERVLLDASVTYGLVGDDGSTTPMLVERAAIVKALGYEDESAWLARTAEINAALRAASTQEAREGRRGTVSWQPCVCVAHCGDDGDSEGPGTCKRLPRIPEPPLVTVVLVSRRAAALDASTQEGEPG